MRTDNPEEETKCRHNASCSNNVNRITKLVVVLKFSKNRANIMDCLSRHRGFTFFEVIYNVYRLSIVK